MINHNISADWCTTKPIEPFSCTPRVQQVHSKAQVIHLTPGLPGLLLLSGSTVVLPIQGWTGKKMAANRKCIGPTTLKRACNSTTNTRTKYLLVVMHKTLCSVWLTFVRRENETVQNCPIVLKNSSSSSYYYYYSYFAVTHKLHKLQS